MRYVSRMGELRCVSTVCCDTLNAIATTIRPEDTPLQAFYNAMLMRMDVGNYMLCAPFPESECDINLFTINRNKTPEIRMYMTDERPKIVSYFTKSHLEAEEYEFKEEELLDLRFHSVCDTRSFIQVKLEGLYLVTDKVISMYNDEYRFSETHLIKGVYHEIVKQYGAYKYDEAKMRGARLEGCASARPPMCFSLAEELCSPSGHVMRTLFEYERGRASLFMFLDKMICNHHFSITGRSRTASIRALVHGGGRSVKAKSFMFDQLNKKYGVIENESRYLWHSALEIVAGIRAYIVLTEPNPGRDYNRIIEQLRGVLESKKSGSEIYRFETKFECAKRLKKYRNVKKSFPGMGNASTPLEIVESLWANIENIDELHPETFSKLLTFKSCTAFELSLIAHLHLDFDARKQAFVICFMMCTDPTIAEESLGDWRSLSTLLAMNGQRRSHAPEDKLMWYDRLCQVEDTRIRYKIHVHEISQDLDPCWLRVAVAYMMAWSWINVHPDWEMYDPASDNDWLIFDPISESRDIERILEAYESIRDNYKQISKEYVERRIMSLFPGAVMRTP
ncbi:hypothetical protein M0802_015386 [Mischocyttarus mexicanus]|nr:hypothetical protein M0802_015386 [Mischocyttarus mexicanus]